MIAVILGCTGLVGTQLLDMLLGDDDFKEVRAISRRALPAHPKLVPILVTELSELEQNKNELGGDVYFCCIGTTIKVAGSRESFRKIDQEAVLSFAAIANFHRAQSLLVITAQGANPDSKIFYNQVKGEVEEELKKMTTARLVIFRPSLLIGNRKEHRTGEALALKLYQLLRPILPSLLLRKAGTEVATLAAEMIAASKRNQPMIEIITAADIFPRN